MKNLSEILNSKKGKIISVLFIHLPFYLLHLTSSAQDIHFSQFTMTPLNLNPAQAGAAYDMRAIANYKNQWGTVAAPYSTSNIAYDMKLGKNKNKKGFMGIGVNVFSDKAGDAKMGTTQGDLSLAYHVYLTSKSTLGAGVYGGFAQRSISYTNLQWQNQYDGMNYNSALSSGEPTGSNSITHADLGGGLHYTYGQEQKYITGNTQRYFDAGISMFHINQPKYSFYSTDEKLNIKTVAYANALIGISNSQLSIMPGFVYFQEGKAQELLMGMQLRYQLKEESKYTGFVKGSAISGGVYYRNKDAVIASFYFELSQYSIGISYDINTSQLKAASQGRGGLEISLRFVKPNPFTSRTTARINN